MSNKLTDEQKERNARARTITLLFSTALLVIIFRLLYLQYWDYESNRVMSEKNVLRKQVVRAERGIILDRKGRILVRNRPAYHISVVFDQIRDSSQLVQDLSQFRDTLGHLVFDTALVKKKIGEARWRKFEPQRILEDASFEVVALIEENLFRLPGVRTEIESRRDYPYGTALAHTLGYTAEISQEELDSLMPKGYALGDRIGRKGLEQWYEPQFKGQNGIEYIQVDAYGRRLAGLLDVANLKPVAGTILTTTIDIELQKIAEQLFPDSIKGALVAIDPRNGDILAMVSRPGMDPNIFSMDRMALRREWAQVAMDPSAPLNNRAIMGQYPPGSLFKFFTAIAGMEYLGLSAEAKPFQGCGGGYRFGRRYQRCWKPSGHGNVNMLDALRESCDVYFYQLGLRLGMARINDIASLYGLGDRTGLDLPGEKRGLLMDSATYNKRFARLGWKWTRGQILHLSIGQGELVTPLQMANAYAALGNGKALYRPRLVQSLRDAHGQVQTLAPEVLHNISIKPQTQQMVEEALAQVVWGPRGTGYYARVPGIRVGGKTGSAETGNRNGKTHSWYAGVGPLPNPTIAVAVVMEQAGHGGDVAAPVAGKLMKYFFLGPKALEEMKPKQVLKDTSVRDSVRQEVVSE